MKYPIDVKNLIVRNTKVFDMFGSTMQKTYDVSTFSSIQFHLRQTGAKITTKYPGYQYRIYAYRATWRSENPVITKLRLNYNIDNTKKFVHVNVELLN
jgi:hypothetical protein